MLFTAKLSLAILVHKTPTLKSVGLSGLMVCSMTVGSERMSFFLACTEKISDVPATIPSHSCADVLREETVVFELLVSCSLL